MAPTGPIAVYGASGYTGSLVVRELQRRGLEHVLSGRDEAKLRRLAAELGTDAPVRAAAHDDPSALRAALTGCAVVVNCAGPFTFFGEPIVRAAIESGAHYVDTTGEQPYMQRVFEHFEESARATGVAVVPAMGFDYVPGDLISNLTARGHEPLRELVVAYAVAGFGVTRGTLRSALEMLRGGDLAFVDGTWRPAGAGPLRAHVTFPEPIGRVAVAKYPAGEIVTVPRHTRTRKVTALIATRAFAPHAALAPGLPFALPLLARALRTPLAPALSRAVGLLPAGPEETARRAARFTILAIAHGEDGTSSRGVVQGSDVYGTTAAIAVHGAELMAEPGYGEAGVLAPASAFDAVAFLNHLGEHGLSYELHDAAVRTPVAAQ